MECLESQLRYIRSIFFFFLVDWQLISKAMVMMPLFLEFHWEIASDGVSDSHGNGCFFSPSSFFLSILCSAPGKRRSHWYTHALHVVGPCLLVCSLKTKSLMAIYKQNTHKQALKPDIGSQPSSCSLRDLLTSLGLSFSIS